MDPDIAFQATNVDERGRDVSQGILQISEEGLTYSIPNKFPTNWPLDCIRRYGCIEGGRKLLFEVGRKCPTGQAIYAFRLYRARELVAELDRLINIKHSQQTSQQRFCIKVPGQVETSRTRKDASTSTTADEIYQANLKSLSYVSIDFEITKALNESARAHAATREK